MLHLYFQNPRRIFKAIKEKKIFFALFVYVSRYYYKSNLSLILISISLKFYANSEIELKSPTGVQKIRTDNSYYVCDEKRMKFLIGGTILYSCHCHTVECKLGFKNILTTNIKNTRNILVKDIWFIYKEYPKLFYLLFTKNQIVTCCRYKECRRRKTDEIFPEDYSNFWKLPLQFVPKHESQP